MFQVPTNIWCRKAMFLVTINWGQSSYLDTGGRPFVSPPCFASFLLHYLWYKYLRGSFIYSDLLFWGHWAAGTRPGWSSHWGQHRAAGVKKSIVHLCLCMACELRNSEKTGCFQCRNCVDFSLQGCVNTYLFSQMSWLRWDCESTWVDMSHLAQERCWHAVSKSLEKNMWVKLQKYSWNIIVHFLNKENSSIQAFQTQCPLPSKYFTILKWDS